MYCPNCSAPLPETSPPASCGNCGALFGPDSNWKPSYEPTGEFYDRAARKLVIEASIRTRRPKTVLELLLRWFGAVLLFFGTILIGLFVDKSGWLSQVVAATAVFALLLLAAVILKSESKIALTIAIAISIAVVILLLVLFKLIASAGYAK